MNFKTCNLVAYTTTGHNMESLTASQIQVYNKCIHGNESIFCTGPAGSGKSFLLSTIVSGLRESYAKNPRAIAVVAPTGAAAYLIGGTTLHRFAGIGIEEHNIDLMLPRAKSKSNIGNWKRSEVLIIDEISMVSGVLLDNLSSIASIIRENDKPFGGIRLIMFGDFLQLPPVSNSSGNMRKLAFQSNLWKSMNPLCINLPCSLRHNDEEFSGLLNSIRIGICSKQHEQYIHTLGRELEYTDGVEPVRLYAKKNKVAAYNKLRLSQLKTEVVVFSSIDTGNVSALNQCPAEKKIELKVGAQVMLTRNISSNLVNGSVGTVCKFRRLQSNNVLVPIIEFVLLDLSIKHYTIEPIEWKMEAPGGIVTAMRVQIPLILAWSMTIHKSQGKTIPRVIIDTEGVFEKGQCYVAFSRCSNPQNIQIRNFKRSHIMYNSDCVKFHDEIKTTYKGNDMNSKVATSVASDTSSIWDNKQAQLAKTLTKLSL